MNAPTHNDHPLALFVPSLRGGGAERVMVDLANSFSRRGFPVDLVVAKAEGPYLAEVAPTVRLVNLQHRQVARCLPALIAYLRRRRPQAVLSTLPNANLGVLWARRLSGVTTRVVIREANSMSRVTTHAIAWKSRLVPYLAAHWYAQADAIIAVSAGVADELAGTLAIPRDRIRVIYNPSVTPDLFARAQEPPEHPWFTADELPVILAVGRLTRQKDYPTLLHAFSRVRKHYAVRLVILGEGEERLSLEGLVRELGMAQDVALPGFMTNPFSYMAHAAVFVLSSAWEGLPNTLIQALALGTPVVATDCVSGPREILDDGQYGPLVPVGDVEALAGAIGQTLTHPLPRERLASAAAPFSLEQSVDRYLQVFTNGSTG